MSHLVLMVYLSPPLDCKEGKDDIVLSGHLRALLCSSLTVSHDVEYWGRAEIVKDFYVLSPSLL